MKIKIAVKDIEKNDIGEKVEEILRNDLENAYTVAGIMVEAFGVKESHIENKPFSSWKKGLPMLYGRIDRHLRKLKSENKVNQRKHGKAWVYWYKQSGVIIKPKDD